MKIKSKQAATLFFPSTSLLFVIYESIANSIDAGASKIDIHISITNFNRPDTLKIIIEDNGEGFTDRNFEKFNNVFDVEDDLHKGIGRLVFLNYFYNTEIESAFENKKRKFTFNDDFDGQNELSEARDQRKTTRLTFTQYRKEKIKTYDYLIPSKIKEAVLEHFLPIFYKYKLKGKQLKISIFLDTEEDNKDFDFYSSNSSLNINDLPQLKEKSIDDPNTLFGYFKLLYSIEKNITDPYALSAICADGRTIPLKIISESEFPQGYKMIFILYSDYFDGKTNSTREAFTLDEKTLKHVKQMFTKLISSVVREEIPEIVEHNKKVQVKLQNEYPHLVGYFDDESLGLADKSILINEAQNKFFNEQKEILEAQELNEEQYERSLGFSSRILTEYILYRSKIINKLKSMDCNNNESDIHDLIVPRRMKFEKAEHLRDYYTNNAWILDDKYMTYSKVLSDLEIETIYKELNITGGHYYSENEAGRPDITIVFSDDPNHVEKVDVVIIEFKKLGLKLADKEAVVSQLRQRARRLIEYYPNKIQRIWFYGVTDFDPEFIVSVLESGFTQLFSKGELYYKNQEIIVNPDSNEKHYADIFLLSYESMLNDAESRNSTFLNILKAGIRNSIKMQ
jgi:hypothetical protein